MSQADQRESRCKLIKLFGLLVIFLFSAVQAVAACHVVDDSAAGAATGADWTNAYLVLPTTLVRGDTYYLADGSYPKYEFDTVESGTTLITIKKAIPSDHCTDTGWNAGSMGSGQAVFNSGALDTFQVSQDYLTVDGQQRTSLSSGHGIKLNGSDCFGAFCSTLNIAGSNLTVRYVEIEGIGDNDPGERNEALINGDSNPKSNWTFQYLYLHHSGQAHIATTRINTLLLEHSYLFHNFTSPTTHGNCFIDTESPNVTIRYNVFHDFRGTACITMRGAVGVPVDNWTIYGNLFRSTIGNTDSGVGNGIIYCLFVGCTNVKIYNNTTVFNLTSGQSGVNWKVGNTGTPNIQNNLWYGITAGLTMTLPDGSTEDYNTALNSPIGAFTGPNDVLTASGAADPFVSSDGGDSHLTAATTTGITLSSPYTTDPDGLTRGADGVWDRGAFEYQGGAPIFQTVLSAPTTRMGLSGTQTVTITNVGSGVAAGTGGDVTYTLTLPTGVTATALSGTGWTSCSTVTVSCIRTGAAADLATSASYPALTLTYSLAKSTALTLTTEANGTGGGTAGTSTGTGDITATAFKGLGLAP